MEQKVRTQDRIRKILYRIYKKSPFMSAMVLVIIPQFTLMHYLLYWAPDFLLDEPQDLRRDGLRVISIPGFGLILVLLFFQVFLGRWVMRAGDSPEFMDEEQK